MMEESRRFQLENRTASLVNRKKEVILSKGDAEGTVSSSSPAKDTWADRNVKCFKMAQFFVSSCKWWFTF